MATYSVDAVEVFGRGVLKSEGVVVDKENNVFGGGRNGVMYKVSPDGKVTSFARCPKVPYPTGLRWIARVTSSIAISASKR
jgi:hypothetical protein